MAIFEKIQWFFEKMTGNTKDRYVGEVFRNTDSVLPEKPIGVYRKFDVTNKSDPRKFVRDMESGDVYYTEDNGKNFVKIVE